MALVDELIAASGAITAGAPLTLGRWWPKGPIVVQPAFEPPTYNDAVEVRRTADRLLVGWIHQHEQAGVRINYADALGRGWHPLLNEWREIPMLSLVGWAARGLREGDASVFADVILSRGERQLPTIVATPVDVARLTAIWHCDKPVIQGLRAAEAVVVVYRQGAIFEVR